MKSKNKKKSSAKKPLQHPISLSFICRDETDCLRDMLQSTMAADCITERVCAWNGTNPETKKILEEFKVKIVPYEWRDDFAHARNTCKDNCSNDIILWLDSDDTLEGAEDLSNHLHPFDDDRMGAIWLFYNYDQDSYGNCTMALWRERIFRKDYFKWEGALHEEATKKVDCLHVRINQDKIIVLHHPKLDRVQSSAKRNLRITTKMYEEQTEEGEVDPWVAWNHARSLNSVGRSKESIELFEEFVETTETDEHRYQGYIRLAELYRKFRNMTKAREYDLKAIDLRPLWPDAYFGIAESHFHMNNWKETIHWTEMGYQHKPPGEDLPMIYNPMSYYVKPLEPYCHALINEARFEDALRVCVRALKFVPTNKYFLNFYNELPKQIEARKIEKNCIDLYDYLSRDGESDKLEFLSRAIPDVAKDHPLFVRLANQFSVETNSNKRIVIYCGTSHELWDPTSIKSGIGGSEEATIYIAKHLVKLGWTVDVYNHCREPGIYDGVQWKGIWEYDREQPADIFIAWRDCRSILLAPENSYKVLWLHDVQKHEYYNKQITEKIDQFFVLSQWHRENLPKFPDDKFTVTRNGIVGAQFKDLQPRNPYRCVYASSPDRGLDNMLNFWPEIVKEVPEAELHVYYGFTATFDDIHKNNKKMMEWKDTMLKALNTHPNVFYHGRVGQDELAVEFLKSGIWTYPTNFTEISCITGMKAQASGMIPVTMTLAALNETVQHGYKFSFSITDSRSQKSFKKRVVQLLKSPEKQEKNRKEMMEWAQHYFDWSTVALEWSDHFEKNRKLVYEEK